jgi:hypothetical protein
MPDTARKRSTTVATALGLVSALPLIPIALEIAFPPHAMQRNLYADRAACERDYSPQQCRQDAGSSSAGTAWHGSYYGPYYYADRSAPQARSDPGPGRSGRITVTEVSMRGGFGSFGRAMSAGG